MATLGDDCYFFITSTCVKGLSCPFRHVEAAKTCKIICQHWQKGNCCRPMCMYRHSTFPIPMSNTDTPCYWETQPVGCTKKICPFKHSKPRPALSSEANQVQSVKGSSGSSQQSKPSVEPDGDNQAQPPITLEESKDATVSKPSSLESVKVDLIEKKSSIQTQIPQTSEEKKVGLVEKVLSDSNNKENGNNISSGTPQEKGDGSVTNTPAVKKKIVRKAIRKKNANGLAVKKTKIVKKVPVKKNVMKKVDNAGENKVMTSAPITAATKSVKQRLGLVAAPKRPLAPVAPPADSESGSESSDSVDNIKVLSMEEILRQKALESMMRKRAAEGKPLPVTENTEKNSKPALITDKAPAKKTVSGKITLKKKPQQSPKPAKMEPVRKKLELRRKKKLVPVTSPESSECEGESTAESSSSSSVEESNESQEDSGPDVRRVIVEVDKEAAARKRAKASLLKKQAVLVQGVHTGKISKARDRPGEVLDKKLKRKILNMNYDSDNVVSSRVKAPLSVKDRLGKPPQLPHAASSSQLGSEVRKAVLSDSPRKAILIGRAEVAVKASSSSSDDEGLGGIRVKTLQEIRQEKISKSSTHAQPCTTKFAEDDSRVLSVKQRLGNVSPARRRVVEEEDGMVGRQVLIAADSGSKSDEGSCAKTNVDQKKAKRRPWRSKKSFASADRAEPDGKVEDGDRRTAVVISSDLPDLFESPRAQLDVTSREENEEESPFARLKRRALQKKLDLQQNKQASLMASAVVQDSVKPEEDAGEGSEKKEANLQLSKGEEEEEEGGGKGHKNHKHKHKHKHHKKSKKERQIYMPPALKNAAQEPESIQSKEEISTADGTAATATKVAPQRRAGPHPIAAAWAAGLSLSSKGALHSTRRALTSPAVTPASTATVLPVGVVGRLGQKSADPVKKNPSVSNSQPSLEPTGAVIKTFSEIMAEKRRRRLEQQANQAKPQHLSSSSSSTPSSSQPSTVSIHSTSPLKVSGLVSSPNKTTDVRPSVPISPIVFSSDNQLSSQIKTKFQAKTSAFGVPSSESSQLPHTGQVIEPISTSLKVQSIAPKTSSLSSSQVSGGGKTSKQEQKVLDTTKTPENKKMSSVVKGMAKKSSGQKKLFKKKKSLEPALSSNPSEVAGTLESLGISIPLPPMTLEEELLLDDGPASSNEVDRLNENKAMTMISQATGSAALQPERVAPPLNPVQPLQKQQPRPELSGIAPVLASPSVKSIEKHKLPASDGLEVTSKKIRLSIDDEFALFDEDMENFGADTSFDLGDSVEPIDDLLQNIDDLLA